MKPVTVSEATRFVSLLFRLNKKLFTAPPCLHQWQKPFKQLIALFIMCTPTLFFNPVIAQFAGGSTGSTPPFIVDPLVQFLTPRSDVSSVSGSLIWGPSDNLLNDGYNVVIQAPTPPVPPAGPFFSNDFRLSVFGPRMVQKSQGNIGTATGDIWNAIGERLPFITSPGFSSNGLRSQWDGISANFGLSDDPTAGSTTRHGLIQWQDISVTSPGSTTNSRLRFVFRDGNAPSAGGVATEVGTALFDGKWGFGLNNIAPLSTVDVKGGLYVGSSATVTAGTGNGYFSNSVRVGSDAFMSGTTTVNGLLLGGNERIGIGTINPSDRIELQETTANSVRVLMRCQFGGSTTNGTNYGVNGPATLIENLDNAAIGLRTGGNTTLTVNSGNVVVNGDLLPAFNFAGECGNAANTWTNVWANNSILTSDRRIKKEIENLNYGLNEVMKLQPVSFRWIENDDTKRNLGFIAQDLNKVITEVVVEGKTQEEKLGVKYTEIIPVLVNAIKEQQSIIEKNAALVIQLENKVIDLEELLVSLTSNKADEYQTKLYQNDPNPTSDRTTIRYIINQPFISATIDIYDDQAQLIKSFSLPNKEGLGSVEFNGETLRKGTYSYALIIDGNIMATKKLLLGY